MHAHSRNADCFHLVLETYSLSNGLKIVLHADPTLPLAAVHLRYDAGSKDDDPHRTGLAHLVEHLMFEGSAGHDGDYFKPLQEVGGIVNGTTGHDSTNYYELVPSSFLERALWLEADRMARLLPVLTDAKFENQRSVVMNERWQRCDNQPYGRVGEVLQTMLYPKDHPYHWPVIGWMDHLAAVQLSDARDFISRYYAPDNAVLAIAGAFDRDEVGRWVEKYFGGIPRGDQRLRSKNLDKTTGAARREDLREEVALGRVDIAWPTVPRYHPDEAPLDVAAQLVGGGRDSRWRRRLEREERLAHSVGAYHPTHRLSGYFGLRAISLPGIDVERIAELAPSLIRDFLDAPATSEEIERVVRSFEIRAYNRVETLLGRVGLLQDAWYHLGELRPSAVADELDRYRQVSPSDVSRVVEAYLGDACASVLVRPGNAPSRIATIAPSRAAPKKVDVATSEPLPPAGRRRAFQMPVVARSKVSQLDVLVVTDRRVPRVQFELIMDAGSSCDAGGRLGTARLMADCQDEGTTHRSSLELARGLESMGAQVAASAGIESYSVMLRTLRSQLREAFQLFAEVVSQPAFFQEDFERERAKLLAELSHRERQPSSIADDAIERILFGESHPYGRCPDGTPGDVAALTPEHLRAFHRSRCKAHGATLIAVGDIEPSEILDLASDFLGPWLGDGHSALAATIPPIALDGRRCTIVPRAGALQSIIRLGRPAPSRRTPDYEALVLLNTVVGGAFSSRLNADLREEKGLTYGASSSFLLRRSGGAFLAGADVDARATAEAVRAMLNEVLGPARMGPITAEELAFAKSYITHRFPARFETHSGIMSHLSHAVVHGLPDDYYHTYLSRLHAVTLGDVNAAARAHLNSDDFRVVVVGPGEIEHDACQAVEEVLNA